MTEFHHDILLAVDIHGNFSILKEIGYTLVKEPMDLFSRMERLKREKQPRQPLDDYLQDCDMVHPEDDYRSFKDIDGRPLERGTIYRCTLVSRYWKYDTMDGTEYDSEINFQNFSQVRLPNQKSFLNFVERITKAKKAKAKKRYQKIKNLKKSLKKLDKTKNFA